ncbi:1-acyl-sn-glycerol-3-phosphate acyltransferase [Guyparkeria hydrothermalis]|uniref:lysophospholipid acyltransferase family protein n=1 Tax=Guyparkeria TaxID=2035712 RepID=UPI0010AC32D3|nr:MULTISPECIES: lysophospholipid acyltransferase family protein [Guyparkeria]MCL7750816.1 1-acyl-sn-glycerol-3-phosphate acyltransferase [Guyparkeria hydrothermalis]TKA88877.1 1-acyl-sn-glycerol-3-phosphate acyltransferase [Guyparkeria sp. SB14A]
MLTWLRTALFALAATLSLLAHTPILLAGRFLPFERRYRLLFSFGRSILWLARVITGIRHEVEGLEHLDPTGGNLVLAKHQSTWETMFLPSTLRFPAFVLKRELLRIPVFGQGLKAIEPIAIDRAAGRKALAEILRQGSAALADGRDVVIFPEGTRRLPGTPPNYRIGGAMLAERSGARVIPMAVDSGCLWPKKGFRMRPGTIHVVFGPPIETEGRTANEINDATQEWIEATQEALYNRHGCPNHVSGTS